MIQESIKQRLLVLRGTLRKACVLDGASRLVLTAVVCLFGGIILDYFFFRRNVPVNTVFRCLMTTGVFLGLAGLIWYRIISPLRVQFSLDDMALAVEKEFPQLNDSLISTLQLTRMLVNDGSISTPMVEEVARQAYQNTASLEFSRVVKFDRVRPVMYSAGGALALVLLLAAVPGLRMYLGVGALRMLNPLSQGLYPTRTFITVSVDGKRGVEKIVPRNEATSITATVSGDLPNQAFILFDHGRGYGKPEPVAGKTAVNEQTGERIKEFQYDYNPVISNFSFIVKAGDNEVGPFSIRAVDRPELNNMIVTYKLPAYITDAPSEPRRERGLRNVVGTQATLQGTFNKAMRRDGVLIKLGNDAPRPVDVVAPDGMSFAHTLVLDKSKDYEIFLNDQDGLDNKTNKIRHKIWVLPDALPKLTWRAPATDLEVSPTANVSLALGLEDDWGLQKALVKFKRYRGVAAAPQQNVPGARNVAPAAVFANSPAVSGSFDLPEPQPGAFNRNAQKLDIAKDWSLAELGLEPGDVVEYWAEAYDWCPTIRKGGEPQIYHLRVLSAEEIRRKLDVERLRLLEDLRVIIRDQENDRKQVDAIKDHLSVGNPFAPADRTKVSDAGALQEEIRRKTHALQTAFDTLIQRYVSNGLDTPEDKERLQTIRDVLETEHVKKMPEAAREIASTALAKADDDRVLNLKNALKKQDEILADLRALLEQMQKWAETEDLLRLTRELLLQQRNVTRLTGEFKDRLGSKKPGDATKEEQGQVKGLEHEQRDCVTNMQALFVRMTQAFAKMMDLDKFVAKNIDDAIKIAQNTDATPDKPDLATTGDPYPGIEDKMRAAQADIRDNYAFGTAGARQKASEAGLERIIVVLSRRRDVDKEMMREIEQTQRELRRILEEQRNLIKRTDNILDKQTLERQIAQARQQLQDVRDRQNKLLKQTQEMQSQPDPQAGKLEESLAAATKDLDQLVKEQNQIFKDTVDQLSPAEREIARAVHELEILEADERAHAKESSDLANGNIEKVLRVHYEHFHKLRQDQKSLSDALKVPDGGKAPADADMKKLLDPQQKLRPEAAGAIAALTPAAEELGKTTAKDSPLYPRVQAAVRALTQAGSLAVQAPDDMKSAAAQLEQAQSKDALAAMVNATDKLSRAEEVLLRALGLEHKRFEDGTIDLANRQADTRGRLDELTNRIANLIRAGNTPEQVAKDKKLAALVKPATQAMPELEAASSGMADAADTLRRGAPTGDRGSSAKASGMQTGAADKIARARGILQGLSAELAKDKQPEHARTGAQQNTVQEHAQTLQKKIENIAHDIEQAHAAAAGARPQPADPAGAAAKVGEAAAKMSDAAKELGKPDPSGATKNESKAIDALEDAKEKLAELRRKVDELKTPARRLERAQKELKDEARKLGTEVKGLQDQLPQKDKDAKPAENIKNATNSMQNAQNSLGAEGGKSGESKNGESKGGEANNKEAAEQQERALSELDKALAALDELSAKAAKEKDPRAPSVLDRMRDPQNALRDDVQRLQKKMDNFRDKTGNRNADRAAAASESAAKNQSSASGQMGQGNQSGAKSNEEQAEQDLQEALDSLDQFQQQMAAQNRSETLFQIEQELKKMLGVQRDLLVKTQDVEKQRPAPADKLPRRARGMLKQVFEDQQKLADATKVVVKKLEDSPVFQFVLQGTGNDMSEAATRLDKEESGTVTQEIQDDVVRNLGDLVEALRKERQQQQQQQQGGGGSGGGGGKQPLVPPLAELKMLRIMQRNVNSQTKKIDDEVSKAKAEEKDLSRDQKERLRRAAVKEGDISRITKRIADELNSGPAAPPVPHGDGEK